MSHARSSRWDVLRPRGPWVSRILASLTLLVAAVCATAAESYPEFESQVRPLLEKFCFECHANGKSKGEVELGSFKTEADLKRDQALWLNVLTQVQSQSMPPAKALQPTTAERQSMVLRLELAMDALDAQAPKDPGRSPIHRLNRAEYNNTIRDLIGLDLHPADAFPADDTAHGFDNLAEVLSLSPLLLEKYLAAAESVLNKAIVADGPVRVLREKIEAEALPKAVATNGAAELRLEQEIAASLSPDQSADYQVRVRAWQTGAGGDPATAVLKIDGVDVAVWSLVTENEPTLLEATIPIRGGSRRVSLRHTWYMELPKEKKAPDARLYVDFLEVTGPTHALAHRNIFFTEPSPTLSERTAATNVLERFASRAFRRPVGADELSRLLGLYERGRTAGKTHVEAARLSLLSILVSPQFLFRLERDESVKDDAVAFQLNDWELATRLSYWLWSSMPDEELLRLAAARQLTSPAELRRQVLRMLADPKAAALADNFVGQWLGLRKLETLTPDPESFPSFKPALRRAMTAEALQFFSAVVHEDRSILEFLKSDWTFVNEDLARHYRIPDVIGGHMRKVALTDPKRGGVVTMGAVLAVTSHPTRTSAVKRGKWVLEEILGAPPPPPPPNVPELAVPAKGQAPATTLRERMERHRSDARCFGCHVRMDTLGLGLENFDAIGRWREKEGEHRIDASGTLPDGRSFSGPAQLKELLAAHKEEFARCFVEKMFTYALGRSPERQDRREVKRIVEALGANNWHFSTLAVEIATSYPFRYRRNPIASEETKAQTIPHR